MKRAVAALALVAVIAAVGCASLVAPKVRTEPAALRAGAYRLDPHHAALLFRVNHLGFSKFVGRFDVFDATLDFDPSNVGAAQVEAAIDIGSLDVANDDFSKTLTGSGWFDAAAYPQAIFRSTSIRQTGGNRGELTGELTLHGVTAPVTLDVTFNGGGNDLLRGGYVVGFSATGSFSRKAFGIDKFDGIIDDDVDIEIEAEFKRS